MEEFDLNDIINNETETKDIQDDKPKDNEINNNDKNIENDYQEKDTKNSQEENNTFEEKGMTQDDLNKWAEKYNCSVQDVIDALDMGWHGPKNFSSDKTFLDPVKFLEKSRQNAPILYNRMKKIQEESKRNEKMYKSMMENFANIQKKYTQEALEKSNQKIKDLENQLKLAKEDYDVEKVEKLSLEKLKAENEKKELENNNKTNEMNPNWDPEMELNWLNTSETAKLIKSDPDIKLHAQQIIHLLDTDPDYKDWSSEQRIAYLERTFGQKRNSMNTNMVGRATLSNTNNNYQSEWDKIPEEFKKVSISIAEDLPWFDKKDTDPEAKKQWEQFKKDVIKSYKNEYYEI